MENQVQGSVGWLLDATIFTDYHDELVAAILRNGHTVKSLNRPNPPYGWDDTENAYRKAYPAGSCVVTHADLDLVQRVLRDGLWRPGGFATIENFYCSHYFSHFGEFLLNQDYVMLPFAELSRGADFLFETLGHDGSIFVRPDSPAKLFTGLVANRATFARDIEFMAFYEFPVESLVVVSSPKSIKAEWRFVVAEQSVVAGSQYKTEGAFVLSPDVDPRAQRLAEDILATGYAPDPVWVMDICQTTDEKFHLLEIGAFSFANLYACEKNSVVNAVSQVALKMQS